MRKLWNIIVASFLLKEPCKQHLTNSDGLCSTVEFRHADRSRNFMIYNLFLAKGENIIISEKSDLNPKYSDWRLIKYDIYSWVSNVIQQSKLCVVPPNLVGNFGYVCWFKLMPVVVFQLEWSYLDANHFSWGKKLNKIFLAINLWVKKLMCLYVYFHLLL